MDPALVFLVLVHLAFDGADAGEDVGVGVDDALGLGGGAGGEDDLEGCLGGDRFAYGEVWLGREFCRDAGEPEPGNLIGACETVQQVPVADEELWRNVFDVARGELRGACRIEGDYKDATEQT